MYNNLQAAVKDNSDPNKEKEKFHKRKQNPFHQTTKPMNKVTIVQTMLAGGTPCQKGLFWPQK